MANSAYTDPFPSVYGFGGGGAGGGFFDSNPEGYMDMLPFQDYGGASLFDLLNQPTSPPQSLMMEPGAPSSTTMPPEASEVNTPMTNSCSISSSSNEAGNDFDQENNNNTKSDDDHHEKTANHQLKVKKKNPKKQKEARFAFMTKTEVDQLDDGYRWRKYGQKAVKNSPFPRSYYRCTSASCGVKKMVERSSNDPSTVVTTYEGTHIHPCPVTSRGMLMETDTYGGLNGRGAGVSSFLLPQQNYQQPQQSFFYNQTNCLSFDNTATSSSSYSHYLQDRQSFPSPLPSSLLRDHGLLQDMLSFQIGKEEPS